MRPIRRRQSATRDESGAVVVLVALLLLTLVGLLAVTIDIARLRVERSAAQGVADNAAVSAAWAACQGKSDDEARTAGRAVAVANGYDDDAIDVAKEGADRWRATLDASIPASMSQAIGGEPDLKTQTTALARGVCAPSSPLPAVFAGSTNCGDKTFEFSGSNAVVNGDIHSNDILKIGGENTVNGQGTFVDAVVDPDKIDWTPVADNPAETAVRPFPIVFDLVDYQPTTVGGNRTAGADFFVATTEINQAWLVAQGLYDTVTKLITPGTYFSSVGIDLGSMGGARGSVTLVTTGQVKVSPSDLDLLPYENRLLIYSALTPVDCDTFGVDISGSDNDWEGVIYAPGSKVKYAGSTGFSLKGSIIARTVSMSGSNWTLTADSGSGPGDKTILLLR